MINEYGAFGGMAELAGETEVLGKITCPIV
jgi:hypothetical protein